MPPRASRTLGEALTRRYSALELTRKKVEQLLVDGQISLRAAEQMYEGLFLSVYTAFETFIEELFIGLLVDGTGLYCEATKVVPRVTVRSHAIARELVVGAGRNYAEWFPYDRTERRAELFFRVGRPFTDLRRPSITGALDVLNRGALIRHAIAHKSRHSLSRFERDVVRGVPLTPRERSPAGFLRGMAAAAPPQTRYAVYSTGVLLVARRLSA